MEKGPVFIAVGGGKGGVGKSLISSGIATALALRGRSTVCVDLDLGGANLHTFFGLRSAEKGIGDFLFRPSSRNLDDYGVGCDVPNLRLIPGGGFIPGIANLYYFQKLKILRGLKRLDYEFVVLDLGAGTNYNVIDFFSITRSGIVVTNPEPTAILNAYEFIKNVLFRIFSRSFKQGHIAQEIIEAHKFGENQQQGSSVRDLLEQLYQVDQEAGDKISAICNQFRPCLVLNMVKSREHSRAVASNLIDICKNFLDIELRYLGAVPRDEVVSRELVKLKNIVISRPESPAVKAIMTLAERCESGFKDQNLVLEQEEQGEPTGGKRQEDTPVYTSTGSEKGDLASMLKRFFKEFETDEGEPSAPSKGGSLRDINPLKVLDPRPRHDEDLTVPVFYRKEPLILENFEIPSSLRQLLVFISELTHLEAKLGKKESQDDRVPARKELAHAWFKTGLILVESGQFSTALRSFERAARLEDSLVSAHVNAACCLMALGRNEEANSRLDNAKDLIGADETGELSLAVKVNKALALFLSGDYQRALDHLKQVEPGNDYREKVLQLKATCLFYLGRLEESASTWQRCQGAFSCYNQAVCLVRLSRFHQACQPLKEFLSKNRNDAEALALMALCYFYLGNLDEAAQILDKALSIEPFNVQFRALKAFVSFKSGLIDRAIKEAQVITRLRPSNSDLLGLVTDIKNELKAQGS